MRFRREKALPVVMPRRGLVYDMHGECHSLNPQHVPEVDEIRGKTAASVPPRFSRQEIPANRLAPDNPLTLPLDSALLPAQAGSSIQQFVGDRNLLTSFVAGAVAPAPHRRANSDDHYLPAC